MLGIEIPKEGKYRLSTVWPLRYRQRSYFGGTIALCRSPRYSTRPVRHHPPTTTKIAGIEVLSGPPDMLKVLSKWQKLNLKDEKCSSPTFHIESLEGQKSASY